MVHANPYLSHIVSNPGVRSGPCIRDTRITVQEILQWLTAGATESEILNDYPYLNSDDVKAVFAFAAQCQDAQIVSL